MAFLTIFCMLFRVVRSVPTYTTKFVCVNSQKFRKWTVNFLLLYKHIYLSKKYYDGIKLWATNQTHPDLYDLFIYLFILTEIFQFFPYSIIIIIQIIYRIQCPRGRNHSRSILGVIKIKYSVMISMTQVATMIPLKVPPRKIMIPVEAPVHPKKSGIATKVWLTHVRQGTGIEMNVRALQSRKIKRRTIATRTVVNPTTPTRPMVM